MSMRITVNDAELQRVQEQLGEMKNKAPNIIARALNRSVSNLKATIPKVVRQDYHVKAGKVKETLDAFTANASKLEAQVKSRGELIGLNHFKVSPGTVNPNRKSQLKIAVKKNGTKLIPGAFNADVEGVKVFKGTGRKKAPDKGSYKGRVVKRGPKKGKKLLREEIERKFGPSVPQMIGNKENVEKINQNAYVTYEKNINHDINRLLSKMGAS